MQISLSIVPSLRDFVSRMDKKARSVERGISQAIRIAGFLVERGSKIRAPVDTGRLRSSIQTNIMPFSATIAPTVNYAIYVHEGTRFLKARPFMLEGVRDVEDEINNAFSKAVRDALQ